MSFAVTDPDAGDLASARRGDEQAFARLYDRHAGVVLSLCRVKIARVGRLAGTEADDACQETFIRAFTMLHRLNGEASEGGFRRWLYAITRRVCAERLRSLRRRARHEGQAMIAAAALQQAAVSDSIAGEASRREALDRLTAVLGALDDNERLAVHLHYLDADPVTAARESLGLSRSAYYKLLQRARAKLAALMRAGETTCFFEDR